MKNIVNDYTDIFCKYSLTHSERALLGVIYASWQWHLGRGCVAPTLWPTAVARTCVYDLCVRPSAWRLHSIWRCGWLLKLYERRGMARRRACGGGTSIMAATRTRTTSHTVLVVKAATMVAAESERRHARGERRRGASHDTQHDAYAWDVHMHMHVHMHVHMHMPHAHAHAHAHTHTRRKSAAESSMKAAGFWRQRLIMRW